MNKKNKKLLSKINKDQRKSSLEKIKRRRRRELFLIVSLFIIIISGITFMFSSFVKLKNIEVQGYNQITKEEILAAGDVNSNLRTWSVDDDEVRDKIKSKYNIFKNVTVASHMPSTIKITVEEYKFIAQNKKNDGSYAIIMENGEVYNGNVKNSYNLPILENFNDDETKLKEVYKNLAQLKEEILAQVSEIINNDDDTLTIYMKDGQKVKVLRASFADKLNYYEEMSTYITDKKDTTLNLVNGAYLETKKSDSEREKKINSLLARSNGAVTNQNVENSSSNSKNSTGSSTNSNSSTNTSDEDDTSNILSASNSTTTKNSETTANTSSSSKTSSSTTSKKTS